ncbi:HAD family hydrolase [Lacticaseibacillus daqingensis]|uniref:HAD family hydrolase n=1 Tax=Lacticaseibacillus daqingensis TaxID=2486014 RepID=UPI000F799537|nr:HAD family hydrolase [Lacticaseibacillus daqingensis]
MDNYLIVSDVDGTLAYDERHITARTQRVLNQLMDAGHEFYLATGRMYSLAETMATQIGPRAEIIAANGAVYDFAGARVHHRLGLAGLAAIERTVAANDLAALYFSDDTVYYTTPPVPVVQAMLAAFAPADSPVAVRQVASVSECAATANNGIVFAPHAPAALERTLTALNACPELAVSASDPTNLELIPRGIDKAVAIAELQAKTGIPAARTIVFGDGMNDLGMLKAAGISVAMGNAMPAVKAVAKHVTATNKEDGLAQFLEQFFN